VQVVAAKHRSYFSSEFIGGGLRTALEFLLALGGFGNEKFLSFD
jgi:hypothetical protein